MKTTSILSAFIFAHAVFAQAATDSSSVAVAASGSTSATPSASGTSSAPSASVVASASSSAQASSVAPASASNTKSSSAAAGTQPASSAAPDAASSVAPAAQSSDAGSYSASPTANPVVETQGVVSSNGNPFIPTSASAGCQTFLTEFNSDTAIASCLGPLVNVLSSYMTSGSASASGVTKTLNTMCASNACSASMMRTKLTAFKDACSAELTGTSPDSNVIKNYDTLYSLIPLKAALCSKDADTQAYCVLNTGSGPSADVTYAGNNLADALVAKSSRRRAAQSIPVPNADAYRTSHLMYLFKSPDMNAGELCTSCTQQIISKYVAFESSTPYASGLKNSPMLGGQSEVWSSVGEKCPADFLTQVTNIAGVDNTQALSAASPAFAGSAVTAFFGALAATFALI